MCVCELKFFDNIPINVSLNDISYVGFIEELPTKEFLEANMVREGPILEYDERVHWTNQKDLTKIEEFILNKQVKKSHYIYFYF